jgi:hypothetical protein
MNRDLFLSILSMDSYNRGYGRNIIVTGARGDRLGKAVIGEDAETLLTAGSAEASGFYAIAYDVSQANIAGLSGTVIAYRGTNFNPNWGAFFGGPLWADIRNGWLAGAGFAVEQSKLALDFYGAVAGTADRRSAAITTTGHSLGFLHACDATGAPLASRGPAAPSAGLEVSRERSTGRSHPASPRLRVRNVAWLEANGPNRARRSPTSPTSSAPLREPTSSQLREQLRGPTRE